MQKKCCNCLVPPPPLHPLAVIARTLALQPPTLPPPPSLAPNTVVWCFFVNCFLLPAVESLTLFLTNLPNYLSCAYRIPMVRVFFSPFFFCFLLLFFCFCFVVVFVWLVVFRVVVLVYNSETFLLGLVLFFHFHCHVQLNNMNFCSLIP